MATIRYTLATQATAPGWLYATLQPGSTSDYYFPYHDGSSTALYPMVIGASDSGPVFSTPLVNPQQLDAIFAQWSSVLNVNFSTTTGEKHVYIGAVYPNNPGWTSSGATYTAHGTYQGQDLTGQYALVLNYGQNAVNVKNLALGTWGGWTAMHELGHVLGLPHNGEPAPKTKDLRMSIMDYPTSFIDTTIKIPLTPGMKDIKDLQVQYGESKAQDGDTTYKFTPTTIQLGQNNQEITIDPDKAVMTLWDRVGTEGGIDTIDASGFDNTQNLYIDLRAGHFSAIGTLGTNAAVAPSGADINGDGDPDGDTTYNVGIAVGAQIENAKGGSGNDYCQSASKTFH